LIVDIGCGRGEWLSLLSEKFHWKIYNSWINTGRNSAIKKLLKSRRSWRISS
jgi:hypothetical protein